MQIEVRKVEFNIALDGEELKFLAGLVVEGVSDPALQQNLAGRGLGVNEQAAQKVLAGMFSAGLIGWNNTSSALAVNHNFPCSPH